jgi:hypothetical protein
VITGDVYRIEQKDFLRLDLFLEKLKFTYYLTISLSNLTGDFLSVDKNLGFFKTKKIPLKFLGG